MILFSSDYPPKTSISLHVIYLVALNNRLSINRVDFCADATVYYIFFFINNKCIGKPTKNTDSHPNYREYAPMKWIDGGVTAPKGFFSGGIHCGIKQKNPDLAMVVSSSLATGAACFTKSNMQAAPVRLCREYISKTKLFKGIVINSGCANACTGTQGMDNARRMSVVAAELLAVEPCQMLVCSTGRIGVQLPMDKIEDGIKHLSSSIHERTHIEASRAILTTDLVPKEAACEIMFNGTAFTVGAMAKGSGMIAPNMATMLAFLTTDAAVEPQFLQNVLREAVENTFNRITVDADTSTNDTVIMLANGANGTPPICADSPEAHLFAQTVLVVCDQLARKIVLDGEGASRLITVHVGSAQTKDDALRAARTIADSLLLKVAFGGNDPNWGRIMAALGRSGVDVDPDKVDIYIDNILWIQNGMRTDVDQDTVKNHWTRDSFTLYVDIHSGDADGSIMTCDITHGYIDINL